MSGVASRANIGAGAAIAVDSYLWYGICAFYVIFYLHYWCYYDSQ